MVLCCIKIHIAAKLYLKQNYFQINIFIYQGLSCELGGMSLLLRRLTGQLITVWRDSSKGVEDMLSVHGSNDDGELQLQLLFSFSGEQILLDGQDDVDCLQAFSRTEANFCLFWCSVFMFVKLFFVQIKR